LGLGRPEWLPQAVYEEVLFSDAVQEEQHQQLGNSNNNNKSDNNKNKNNKGNSGQQLGFGARHGMLPQVALRTSGVSLQDPGLEQQQQQKQPQQQQPDDPGLGPRQAEEAYVNI
ncbi:unnamed protein product, partial [Polarella glacialis]